MQVFRRDDQGEAVAEIRAKLRRLGLLGDPADSTTDDVFDAATDHAVRGFQQARGLRVDGQVGAETYRALDEAHWQYGDRLLTYVVAHPFVGDDVIALQQRLLDLGFDPGRHDGIYGAATAAALSDFQRNTGLRPDGTLGPETMRALDQLRRTVTGGSPAQQREEERLLRGGGALAGRIVVLDPGHGGDDRGAVAAELSEADIAFDLAARIEGRLGALGVTTYLTRGADTCPDHAERAGFANQLGADLFLSLHAEAVPNEGASGSAGYYYGTTTPAPTGRSAVGERLADLVQREVAARTDLVDGRTQPKSWELLRLTRMPAVWFDAGYLSNLGDRSRLASPEFRDTLAEAVVAAMQRLYLPEPLDLATGQFRIPALVS